MVGVVEASHFDAATAYAAVEHSNAGDEKPYIYRTRDYGQSWQLIVNGLPTDEATGSFVRVVREDTMRRGLLFAGTETTVHVSFDDGDHWQSLRLNLPNTSYRDLLIHGNDLVAGTYGRSFFVLDDISPLRQLTTALVSRLAGEGSYLFTPGAAIRVRSNINMDTPLPPEVPHALNPPEGAIVDYYLGSQPVGDIKIEIYDVHNKLVRTLSNRPAAPLNEPLPPVPSYWLRPPHALTTNVGTNRTNWDLRYDDPPALSHNWAQVMAAVYRDTPYTPQGALVLPGTYTLKLTVDGKTTAQTLTVDEDPRIGESPAVMAGLRAQFDLEQKNVDGMAASNTGYNQANQLRAQLKSLIGQQLPLAVAQAVNALDAKTAPVQGPLSAAASGPYGVPAYTGNPGFTGVNGAFAGLMVIVEYESDHEPVDAQVKAFHDYCTDLDNNLALWRTINTVDVPTLNELLRRSNLKPLTAASPPSDLACGTVPAGFAAAPAR
jgi:predicted Fe-Mo cluster-binding NifX family protein